MNENEKKLFYRVLKDSNIEEPSLELISNIMYIVQKKGHRRAIKSKILEIMGYSLLAFFALFFVAGYLFFYTDFKVPTLKISFDFPSKIYIIILSIIFSFCLVDLYFRKRLYAR
jgi:hypothetical protein